MIEKSFINLFLFLKSEMLFDLIKFEEIVLLEVSSSKFFKWRKSCIFISSSSAFWLKQKIGVNRKNSKYFTINT
jgi:hypothetical protein